jgi:hypothetical protein
MSQRYGNTMERTDAWHREYRDLRLSEISRPSGANPLSGYAYRAKRIGNRYYKYDMNGNVVSEQDGPYEEGFDLSGGGNTAPAYPGAERARPCTSASCGRGDMTGFRGPAWEEQPAHIPRGD